MLVSSLSYRELPSCTCNKRTGVVTVVVSTMLSEATFRSCVLSRVAHCASNMTVDPVTTRPDTETSDDI